MPTSNIIEYPDTRLSQPSVMVEQFDENLVNLVNQLISTLKATNGIGLSAPQIGINKRISIVHIPDDEFGLTVYINPKIISKNAIGFVEESCLSIPEVETNIVRSTEIEVEAQDLKGNTFHLKHLGMHAVCLQHEIDHLDGKLILDHMFCIRRWQVKNRLKKQQAISI